MLRRFEYRIYPNKEQQTLIFKTCGCARLLYNKLLDWYTEQLKEYKENKTNIPNLPQPTYFKNQEELKFLKEIDSDALANARIDFQSALTNYRNSKKGTRKGRKMGFPKHKTRNKAKWTYKTQNRKDSIRFDEQRKHIKLPKLGFVKIVEHRPIKGVIRSATITKTKSWKFYVSFVCDVDRNDILKCKKKNRRRKESYRT